MSYKTHQYGEPAQFYYGFLFLSSIASRLSFQVIIALCTLEWHKLAPWGENQLAGCPSLPVWPGHDKHTCTHACERPLKCAETFQTKMCLGSASRLNDLVLSSLATHRNRSRQIATRPVPGFIGGFFH